MTELENLVESIETAKAEYGKRKNDFNIVERDLIVAKQELKDLIKQVGICPTCGKELDPEEFIATTSKIV